MKKRLLSALLALCMVLTLLPSSAFATNGHHPFTDVSDTAWYSSAVQYVYEHGMMTGTNSTGTAFSPDSPTSRGMIVTILHRLEGTPSASGMAFADVPTGQWYTDAVAWASANNIMNGYGNGKFGPADPITREQMATTLYRYAQYKGYDTTITGDVSSFSDGGTVSSYAVDAVNWAIGVGLFTGIGNNMFAPTDGALRSQTATVLMRFCENIASEYHTVTFVYNYDDKGTYSTVTVEHGKTVASPTSPTRSGYTFNGWYTATSGGSRFDFSTAVTSDLTLYAHWTSTVGSPGGGGSSGGTWDSPEIGDGQYRIAFNTYNGVYQVQRLDAGEKVSKPEDPTRDLYGFTGWYLEAAAITEYDFDTPVVSDLTLYAGWGNPDGSDDELYFASNETETIFSITDIEVNGNDVTVTYNTNNVALVVVEFFPDRMEDGQWTNANLNANLALDTVASASGYTEQYGELVNITLPINGALPENYLVRASLLDDEHSSVDNALATYVTARYTGTYAKFDALTANDFEDQNLVINFDENDDKNFGVINENVIVIPVSCQSTEDGKVFEFIEYLNGDDNDGEERYTDYEDGNMPEYQSQLEDLVPKHGYKFPNKDAVISGGRKLSDLQVGDIIYIEGTTYMFKIGDIKVEGDSITFTQDENASMADFYTVLKVDFEGIEVDPRLRWEIIDVNASGSASLSLGLTKELSNGVKVSGSVNGKVTGKVKMSYDAHLFSDDYFEAEVSFVTEISGNVKAEISTGSNTDNNHEWKNVVFQVDTREISLPTPVTGLDIYIKPAAQIDWKLSGGVSVTWTSKQTSGFKYNSDTGRTDIAKKEQTASLKAEGGLTIKIGPILDIGIKLFGGVLKGGFVAEAGAKLEAKLAADLDTQTNADSKHACTLCFTGEAKWYAEVSAKVDWKITDSWTGNIINAKLISVEGNIEILRSNPGKFFVSIINDTDSPFGGNLKFGGGDCTNKTYRTQFITQDENGQDISGIQVSVVRQGQTVAKTGASPYTEYLYDGTYNASAAIDGSNVSKTVAVSGNKQTVVLSASTTDTKLEGTVVDANSGRSISGASVTVSKGDVVVASAMTNASGRFSIAVPEGSLTVEVSKENYTTFSSTERVYEGEATHPMGQIELNPGTGMGGFRGVIRDATNNQPIEGVTLRLYEGWNNSGAPSEAKRTLTTNSSGEFRYNTTTLFGSVIGLPSGNYTLTASKNGYTDTSYNIVIYPGTTDENPEIIETMSPEMNDGYYRIVLTWGLYPSDLDSHLVADTDLGGNIHVYFSSMNPEPNYANLDTDDVDSYGPETITITNFEGLSNIRYAVHDFSNRDQTYSNALANSGAVVRLYKGSELLRTFNVPTGYDGTEWDVFTLYSDGRIVTVNTMTYANDPDSVLGLGIGRALSMPKNDVEVWKDYEFAEAVENDSEPKGATVENAADPKETETEDTTVEESVIIIDPDINRLSNIIHKKLSYNLAV